MNKCQRCPKQATLHITEVLGEDRSEFAAAVETARAAEVAIVVVAGKSGLHRPVTVGEGNDAISLELTGVQTELVEALAVTGTPLVVVVLSGRVHTLERIAVHANALVQLFPPGEEGGNGLADVLTGAVSPSGRLPVTLPRSVGQVPAHYNHRAGGRVPMFFNDYVDSVPTPMRVSATSNWLCAERRRASPSKWQWWCETAARAPATRSFNSTSRTRLPRPRDQIAC